MFTLLENCNLLDTVSGEILPCVSVLIEGSKIKEINEGRLNVSNAVSHDLKGKTLMPGLCDAHVHVTAFDLNLAKLESYSPSYITARSLKIAEDMLKRGFTTVRDAGGADWGLALAIKENIFNCPRLLFCGHALSQTGGHGDLRGRNNDLKHYYSYPELGILGRLCDGATEVRRAARDELRKGATHLKIMASGGVVSPNDPVGNNQFSLEEIRAVVEEAEAAKTYVMAHAYTAESIKRALDCGVRSIEHGNLIDEDALDLLVSKNAFLVPTLATYEMLCRKDSGINLPQELIEKAGDLKEKSITSLEMACSKLAKIAFGTDLLGPFHKYQSLEFILRRQVMTPIEIIRSATTVCAELFNMQGQIGVIAQNAFADLLIIEGNPLEDIKVLLPETNSIKAVMKEGRFIVNNL